MSDYRIEAATKEEWAIRAMNAETKLAKAVEALQKIGKTYSADGSRLVHSDKQIINMVYIVLVELEGEPLGAEFEAVWDANKEELYEP